jgi:dihydroflavonol-4-reductase
VVDAHVNAMTKGRTGERYAVVSANLSYKDAAAVFAKVSGSRPPLFEVPGPLLVLAGSLCETYWRNPPLTKQVAWLSQHKIFFSSKKAIEELDFHETPFEETVRRTAPYYLGVQQGNSSQNPQTSLNV